MSVYDDVLNAVIQLAEQTRPYTRIVVGSMPAENGIAITWANGAPETTFLSKNSIIELSAVLNGKHSDQQVVSGALGEIHQVLTRSKTYPSTAEYQILDIKTIGAPCYLGRESNSQWLYGSSLGIKFYWR